MTFLGIDKLIIFLVSLMNKILDIILDLLPMLVSISLSNFKFFSKIDCYKYQWKQLMSVTIIICRVKIKRDTGFPRLLM